jgi:general secretion pathway protein B
MEPEPALPTPAQVASIEQPAPPSTAATASVFASPDAPVKLSDLSAEDREQLPILKVSMHMWSPEAGNRFAIIDGTRVNEGDRVGEATIEAIRQDSVMLSWRGRQIRLPIR